MAHWTLHRSGPQVVMSQLAERFLASGHEVDFVTTIKPGPDGQEFRAYCDQLWHCARSSYQSPQDYLVKFRKEIERRGYDLLLTHHSLEAVAVAGLLPTSIVNVSVIHDDPMRGNGYVGLSNKRAFDAYVGVSKGVTEAVRRISGGGCRVECIVNGVRPGRCLERPARAVLQALFVGRLVESQKGILLLPDVMREARNRGIPIELTVMGDGEDRQRLIEATREANLTDCVTFLGNRHQREVFEQMEGADLLLLPSRHEGLALVLPEAMVRGCVPIAAHLEESTVEVVTSGVDGFLIEDRDPASYVDAIAALWGDAGRLRAMRAKAHEKASAEFDDRRMGQQYEALFAELRQLPLGRPRVQHCPSFIGSPHPV